MCQEKAEDIAKTLTTMNEKGDLNDKQQVYIRRKQSTLTRLNNPFSRPSQPLYQDQTQQSLMGQSGKAIAYRSIKQLLRDNYELLNKQNERKQRQSHQRYKAQVTEEPINLEIPN